ncbi:MAG: hypothetical protein MUE52_17350 [Tabrizicola sp.]|nr:hypothetical protein [Tabrizicola sp.]
MRINDFCFIFAAQAGLCGMMLGLAMGISQDFTLAPAHAHLNLLGWVTMAIYGLYHRGIGRTGGFAGWLQVGSGALGTILMVTGLGVYLATGNDDIVVFAIAGSCLVILAMVMFLGLVLTDMLRVRRPSFEMTAQSG